MLRDNFKEGAGGLVLIQHLKNEMTAINTIPTLTLIGQYQVSLPPT
jgi:hypothetical protein